MGIVDKGETLMVYHRYGSPSCPNRKKVVDHTFYELIRAYYRNPEKRTFDPIGWFCKECNQVWVDGDPELLRAQER